MESNGIAVPPVDDFGRTWSHAAPARRYKPEDIVNCNEADLVWQAKSGKTFASKSDKGRGNKKLKQRVPVLSCANISGTETKLLLFFERFKTLTAFRGRENRLPVQYKWNKKAWMTRLLKWKIALVLDNATCHPKELDLSNIDQPHAAIRPRCNCKSQSQVSSPVCIGSSNSWIAR